MKNFARVSIAALALASVLGVSACSSSDTSNKPAGFTDKVQTSGTVPADWKDGAGWVQDKVPADLLTSAIAIGDNTGYLAPDASGPGFHLVVVDSKGTKLYSDKDSNPSDVSSTAFARVSKDDKSYWVMTQTDGKKDAAPDAKKNTHLTIVDETGKEIVSKTLENTYRVNVVADAVLVLPASSDAKTVPVPTKIIDVTNGNESDVPKLDGHQFSGRFNGVDVFYKTGVEKGAVGTVTDGKWKAETTSSGVLDRTIVGVSGKSTKYDTTPPSKVGKFLQVERVTGQKNPVNGTSTKLCDLLDPKTGKPASNAGGGQCFIPIVTSPDGTFVYFGGNTDSSSGVIDLSTGKTYMTPASEAFTPLSISDNGDAYGKTSNGYASFNVVNDSAPKPLDKATSVPVSLSKSGLAVFLVDGSKLEFVVKKDEKK